MQISNYGVTELGAREQILIDGGLLPLLVVGAIAVGVVLLTPGVAQ